MELYLEHMVDVYEFNKVPQLEIENVVISSDDEIEDVNTDNNVEAEEMQDVNID